MGTRLLAPLLLLALAFARPAAAQEGGLDQFRGVRSIHVVVSLHGNATQFVPEDRQRIAIENRLTAQKIKASPDTEHKLMFEVMSFENDEGLIYYACTAAFARSADVLNRPDATSGFVKTRMILWMRTSFGTVGRDNAVASMAEVINNQMSQFLAVHAKANAAFTGAAVDDPVKGSLSQNALIGVRGIAVRPNMKGLPAAYTSDWLNSITTEALADTSVPVASSGIDHLEVELDGSDRGSEWLVLITISLRRFGVVALPGTTTSFRGVVWNSRRIVRYDKGDSTIAKNLREMLAGLVAGLPK